MPENDDLLEVIRREKLLLDPTLRASVRELELLLHPDFVEFGSSGKAWDRTSIIPALTSAPEVSGTSSDFRAEQLADDVVLLTYRTADDRDSLRSSVWVREAGDAWRLRFHQGTYSS